MGFSSARNLGRDISAGFSPPRRMPISEAVKKFMRVPKGAGNSVPWDPELTTWSLIWGLMRQSLKMKFPVSKTF